ncbi:MAG: tRNA (adenosine(37)-N6)-dimethylallyltransferase MiaA [Paludibacteraceae bacterium]|nr:tRNA (adenosine(37)-N6)-dimethylallyltransferase MiaA [Paludibacteraceae bacterium]MBO7316364.1 tRNA (adenosine(37)-N6)-dimethylallyltransferase MiaA [Paludibacteraceae bacterium]
MKDYNLITILGTTATGKTTLACSLANKIGSEIISADSRQVYRGMTIGTGKDLDDYVINGKQIPYHLIDIADAGYKYNVFEFQRDFLNAFHSISEKNKIPILCGGTGLYIESVLKGYRMLEVPVNQTLREELENKTLEDLVQILSTYKTLHNKTDVDTKKRAIRAIEIADYYSSHTEKETDYPEINSLIIGIDISREERRKKITERLKKRFDEGMIEEVKSLINNGVSPDDLIYYGLEYKFITNYILGKLTYSELFSQLEIAIHQFAKRQMTWFRGMERRGFSIKWIDVNAHIEEKLEIIQTELGK